MALSSHQLVAQVLFSPSGKSAPSSQGDTSADPNAHRQGFSVWYFDSTGYSTRPKTVTKQARQGEIDAMLAQRVDSLFGEIRQRGVVTSRSVLRLQSIPAIPPLRLATWQEYQISSRFGWRRHPIGGDARLHNGLDLPQPTGTPVYATADGVVKWAGWQPGGLGLSVCIQHPTGYQTTYGHLSTYSVRKGAGVRRGALIGRVGSTGRSTGPHLHYTILYRGKPVDPARYCFLWVKLARTEWWPSVEPGTLPSQSKAE